MQHSQAGLGCAWTWTRQRLAGYQACLDVLRQTENRNMVGEEAGMIDRHGNAGGLFCCVQDFNSVIQGTSSHKTTVSKAIVCSFAFR